MNILYVCGHDPRDVSFGGAQRTNLLWKALNDIGDVYTVCYYPKEGKITNKIYAVNILPPSGKRSYINRIIKRLWNFFDKNGNKILPIPSEFSIKDPYHNIKFDVVVCRYIDPAAIFHLWKIAPLYIDVDDHPIEAFNTRDKLNLKYWQQPFALLLQKLKFRIIQKKTEGGWIANPEQVKLCKFNKDTIALKNIPNSPSLEYKINSKRKKYIFSIGFMEYQPNYMGIDKFISEIWYSVHIKYPDLEFYIAGKGAPFQYTKKWESCEGVKYLGYVDNLEPLYENSLATVVAIDQGSGTCIKTLESLSYSRVCLSRPFGIRGIEKDVANGYYGLYVYNNCEEFISLLEKYVLNPIEREEKERNASLFIKKYYSESSFFESVKSVIKK